MQRVLISMVRRMPLRMLYFMMAFVAAGYAVFNRPAYRAIYRYFRFRHGNGRIKAWWNALCNHYEFGKIILDRFAMYAGKEYGFDIEGYEHFAALDTSEEGFMIYSSHVGNYEVAGYSLVSEHKQYNALVYGGESPTVMENRRRMFAGGNINMIVVSDGVSHLYGINNALADGEIVSMPCDRLFGSQKVVGATLLGAPVRLPMGPFAVAEQRGVQTLAVFVMKSGLKRYRIHIIPVEGMDACAGAKLQERMERRAASYAAALDGILRRYPRQWFNYYDFWQQ